MDWIPIGKAEIQDGARYLVCAWEWGCNPVYIIAKGSTLPGHPPKFYLDESYHNACPINIGEVVRFVIPLPEISDAMYCEAQMIRR